MSADKADHCGVFATSSKIAISLHHFCQFAYYLNKQSRYLMINDVRNSISKGNLNLYNSNFECTNRSQDNLQRVAKTTDLHPVRECIRVVSACSAA